jgi:ATP-binding cassette subfamily B protein
MFKLLKKLSKKDIFVVLICLLLIFAQVWLELKMPDYMSAITQLVQTEGSQMQEILKNGAYMLACAFGSLVAAVFTRILNFKCFCKIFI